MKQRHALGMLLTAGMTLAAITCAPVTPPAATETAADTTPVEKLTLAPKPIQVSARTRIEAAIENIRKRDLLTTNGFWTIFHGILGLGPGITLRNSETGQKINAVEHIASGGELRGLDFIQTKYGLDVHMGPVAVGQGHQDQFIAEMAQWGMPIDKPFIVQGKDYTFRDFVNHSKMRARTTANQELGWTILVLAHYYGTDLSWTNAYNEKLTLDDLLQYELDQSMDAAACGGTHRLFGLTWCLYVRQREGKPLTPVYQRIIETTNKHRDLAKKQQNGDGALSTNFFRGPGNAADKPLRINTTGHMLEWLALALNDEEIKEEWVQNAATALALLILDQQDAPIDGGPLYHAVHGLLMYYARAFDRETLGPKELLIPLPPVSPSK